MRLPAASSSPPLRVDHQPWGHFDVLAYGPGFLVKTLAVLPGCRLSRQRHALRSELWHVLQGTASVQVADTMLMLTPGMQTAIPAGQWHRLHNSGPHTLVVLELQTGPHCSEDDIERAEDDFGRTPR